MYTNCRLKMLAALLFLLAHMFAGVLCHGHHIEPRDNQAPISDPKLSINGVPYATRAYWMRQANLALPGPCPFAAFGSVIVNHTANNGLGQLVCTGANSNRQTGNPTLHGMYMYNKLPPDRMDLKMPNIVLTCVSTVRRQQAR